MILDGWEDVYKKGQLTLWILLALKDGPKHMAVVKQFIHDVTNGSIEADDKSMYRALRRYHGAEMVDFCLQSSDGGGPDHKVYSLTDVGAKVLAAFTRRNITDIFFSPTVTKLLC